MSFRKKLVMCIGYTNFIKDPVLRALVITNLFIILYEYNLQNYYFDKCRKNNFYKTK